MAVFNVTSVETQIAVLDFSGVKYPLIVLNVDLDGSPPDGSPSGTNEFNFSGVWPTAEEAFAALDGLISVAGYATYPFQIPGVGNSREYLGDNGLKAVVSILNSGTRLYTCIEYNGIQYGYPQGGLGNDNGCISYHFAVKNKATGKIYYPYAPAAVSFFRSRFRTINMMAIANPEQIPFSPVYLGDFSVPVGYNGSIPGLVYVKEISDAIASAPSSLPNDPFTPGGESDVGGGTGNFDGTSVDVDFATLPTLSAADTGFITLYNPTLTQLHNLANYMWSGAFDLDTFKKLFADPMQAILGLSIVPGPVPSGGVHDVVVGNISTGVSMTKAATQYIDIDCGTLNVEEYWGAYLDYEPYTKAEIYLPFIGTHQIAVDDIMNKAIHIKYHIDLLSGGCACEIKCGGSVLYTFIGSCAVSIPVTGSDWTNLINGVLSAATAIGTMVATGGASAPAAASTIASAAVNSLKPSIEKSGSISGAGGLLAGKVPVLILTRPRQALPTNQNTYTGYPAFITRSLGALSGYTEVHSIRLSGIDGTESEIDEIEELLKGGVIL